MPRRSLPATTTTCSSRSGERLLITRKLTGNFPDYERVLPKEHSALVDTEARTRFARPSSVSAQFADERSRAIRVQFTSGEVRIFSSSVETGESEESVPGEYDGPDLEIGFNAQYLLDFLRAISQDKVAFELEGPEERGRVAARRAMALRTSTATL